MDRFRIKHVIPGAGGLELLRPGGEPVPADRLPPGCDKKWLLETGAIEVVGSRPALSLLPDNPSDQDFRDEIDRLQTALLEAQDEAERVKTERPAVQKFAADPKTAEVSDNLGKKLREAELERDDAERRATEAEKQAATLRQQCDKLTDRLTELEKELADSAAGSDPKAKTKAK